ncbi:MAG: hypothetical protein RLZZ142_1210 [Verrucomicrobiota bacterium]|jgi:hypothetical protein
MKNLPSELTRRRFLERFASACLGVRIAAPHTPLGANSPLGGKAKSVICLYMRGGISHIDTFDPKPGKPEMAGVQAIPTSADGVQISEWFPLLAKQMHHITLVRSMTSLLGIHEMGAYTAHTSYLMTPTIRHPSLSSWAVHRTGSQNSILPGNILINGSPQHPGCGYLPSHLAPLPIGDPNAGLQNATIPKTTSPQAFERRSALAQALGTPFVQGTLNPDPSAYQALHREASALVKSKDLQVFDLHLEKDATRDAYGRHAFGQGCLLARRLVESGVRFIEVEDEHNWDTHNDQVASMRKMTPQTDQAMAALLADLAQRGLLSSTLVMMITEFGRTPKINEATAGRGHHPGVFTWWLGGGGIKAGTAYGQSDPTAERVADKPVTMADFNATVALAMGLDLHQIETSPSGRPFTIADKGKPVQELFA